MRIYFKHYWGGRGIRQEEEKDWRYASLLPVWDYDICLLQVIFNISIHLCDFAFSNNQKMLPTLHKELARNVERL